MRGWRVAGVLLFWAACGGDGGPTLRPPPVCGDGVVDPGEACDDGNNAAGDGCRGDCLAPEGCGNAIVEPGEECDDANELAGDGCRLCVLDRCGDGQAAPGELCYAPRSAFAAGGTVRDLVTADFDGDGALDVAALVDDAGPSRLTLLFGDGAGGFSTPFGLPAHGQPRRILMGDWDGNGAPDLALFSVPGADALDDAWTLLFNSGDGATWAIATVPIGAATDDAVVIDREGDGDLDLAWVVKGEARIQFLENDGRGGFARGEPFLVFAPAHPLRMAAGDWDGDGRDDLAVYMVGLEIELLHNRGDGGFEATRVTLNDPCERVGPCTDLVGGDFDGDGDLDLFVSPGPSSLASTLYSNDGTGAFRETPIAAITAAALAAADLDGDGVTDLAGTDGTIWLAGSGVTHTFIDGDGTHALALADVDGDGAADVLAGIDTWVRPYHNVGDGSVRRADSVPAGDFPLTVATGDLDADGDVDAVVLEHGLTARTLLDDGTGVLSAAGTLELLGSSLEAELGDLDGDGAADLVTNTGIVAFNDGTGAFGAQARLAAGNDVELGDIDGDGDLDLVSFDDTASPVGDLVIERNDGTGVFTGSRFSVRVWAHHLLLADFDADGDLDIAAAGLDTVAVFFNDGAAAGFHVTTLAAGGPSLLALAAFHLDAAAPVALTVLREDETASHTILIFPDPAGSAAPFGVFADPDSLALAAGDLDGDGLDDLVMTGESGAITILRNTGGALEPVAVLPSGVGGADLALADLNGDGLPDILAANPYSNDVTVLRSNP